MTRGAKSLALIVVAVAVAQTPPTTVTLTPPPGAPDPWVFQDPASVAQAASPILSYPLLKIGTDTIDVIM